MRSAALIALLPFLATFAAAAPSPHTRDVQHTRKSLSFGPKHHHAVFETLEVDAVPEIGLNQFVDPKDVARRFIAQKLGSEDAFYIRPDVSGLDLFDSQGSTG
jgi:extracellular elastinolytic metalloproteinase